MYRENARRDYPNLAKCKKRTAKKIRKAIKQQLQYIRRDMGYVEAFLLGGVELTPMQAARLSVLRQVYEQQQYMYENNTHTVPDRIVRAGHSGYLLSQFLLGTLMQLISVF